MAQRGKNLTNEQRQHLAEYLLEEHKNGKIVHSKRVEVAAMFNCSIRTVSTIWSIARAQIAVGSQLDVRHRMVGHPPQNNVIDLEALRALPATDRRTVRGTTTKLHLGKSTIQRAVAANIIRSHTNSIKLALTTHNKVHQMIFCLAKLDADLRFRNMDHIIHIDEKWFYLTQPTVSYMLAPDEVEPYRTCKHKSHIPKLMFMCAVSRPIWGGEDDTLLFDGKIGMFPFVQDQVAINNSKNRPAGTVEQVPVPSIIRDITRAKIIDGVIPAIKNKWPVHILGKYIRIQQDNARPHIKINDPDFMAAANTDGFTMKMVCQPARSPDCNILDLGFFNSIQSLQHEHASSNVMQLLEAIHSAFEREDAMTLNKVFLTHQQSMIEILKARGSNCYKLPHMDKDRLIMEGTLPRLLQVDEAVVRGSIEHLITKGVVHEDIIPLMVINECSSCIILGVGSMENFVSLEHSTFGVNGMFSNQLQ